MIKNFVCNDCGGTVCEEAHILPMLNIQGKKSCVRCRLRIEKALENYVCIPKGENRHIRADMIHEWAEGATVGAYNSGNFYEIINPNFSTTGDLSIKPSEPVYEWQWCVVMDDGTASIYGYHTEDAINELFNKRNKFRIDATKRERK